MVVMYESGAPGLRKKLQNLQLAMQTLVVLLLRSIIHVTIFSGFCFMRNSCATAISSVVGTFSKRNNPSSAERNSKLIAPFKSFLASIVCEGKDTLETFDAYFGWAINLP